MDLDPKRYPHVRLADLSHTLPVPGTKRHFSQEEAGERVDAHDPFWALLIADGSLVPVASAPASMPVEPSDPPPGETAADQPDAHHDAEMRADEPHADAPHEPPPVV